MPSPDPRAAYTISQADIGVSVTVRGRASRLGKRELRLAKAAYRCGRCKSTSEVSTTIGAEKVAVPDECPICGHEASRARFTLDAERSEKRLVQCFDLWSGTGKQAIRVVISGSLLNGPDPKGPVVVSGVVVERRPARITKDGLFDPPLFAIVAESIRTSGACG